MRIAITLALLALPLLAQADDPRAPTPEQALRRFLEAKLAQPSAVICKLKVKMTGASAPGRYVGAVPYFSATVLTGPWKQAEILLPRSRGRAAQGSPVVGKTYWTVDGLGDDRTYHEVGVPLHDKVYGALLAARAGRSIVNPTARWSAVLDRGLAPLKPTAHGAVRVALVETAQALALVQPDRVVNFETSVVVAVTADLPCQLRLLREKTTLHVLARPADLQRQLAGNRVSPTLGTFFVLPKAGLQRLDLAGGQLPIGR